MRGFDSFEERVFIVGNFKEFSFGVSQNVCFLKLSEEFIDLVTGPVELT